jgi:hypothetical protein
VGRVVGASDRTASEPACEPVTPAMMMATLFHQLFDLGELRVQRGLPREILAIVEGARPIPELI